MIKPPRVPYFLLSRFVPGGIKEFFLGDLEEQFQALAADSGIGAANRWFWKQTINSVVPLLGLAARKNLQVTIFRLLSLIVVVAAIILIQPMQDSYGYLNIAKVLGLQLSAFFVGLICGLIIHNLGFVSSLLTGLLIFSISLIIRGEWSEIPGLVIVSIVFVSSGLGLARIIKYRKLTNPEIKP